MSRERARERYFVVPAPGYYGDRAKVWSSHATIEAADQAAGKTGIVRIGDLRKGATWLRVYEDFYPVPIITENWDMPGEYGLDGWW